MAIHTYEAPPKEHTVEIRTPKRGERSNLASFSEAESAPKPLVAFDVPPVPSALPQTW
jgi:hypothetical protein